MYKVLYEKSSNKVQGVYPFVDKAFYEDVMKKVEREVVDENGETKTVEEEITTPELVVRNMEPYLGFDEKRFATINVETVPTVNAETETLYCIDGQFVIRTDEAKISAIARYEKQQLIAKKKALLIKYREDVEQVDLFGMERADYAEKKAACKTLVEELRKLEKELRS